MWSSSSKRPQWAVVRVFPSLCSMQWFTCIPVVQGPAPVVELGGWCLRSQRSLYIYPVKASLLLGWRIWKQLSTWVFAATGTEENGSEHCSAAEEAQGWSGRPANCRGSAHKGRSPAVWMEGLMLSCFAQEILFKTELFQQNSFD